MREVAAAMRQWVDGGRRIALATVLRTGGSSPRQPGACLLVCEDSLSAGSVSAGCVETAVLVEAIAAIEGAPPKLLEFGPNSDPNYWDVALSCGGEIHIRVERPAFEADDADGGAWWELLQCVEAGRPVVRVVPLDDTLGHLVWQPDGSVSGSLSGSPEAVAFAVNAFAAKRTGASEDGLLFAHVVPSPDRLVIIGAVHIAAALVRLAQTLGFETVVIDPRSTYADPEGFDAEPDALMAVWPEAALAEVGIDADTYAVVLTHDPKIDDLALRVLLPSEAAYVGALGSSATQSSRRERLLSAGMTEAHVSRLYGPVGLSIGAKTPEEIALSILAEIVQTKRARIAEVCRP